MTFVFGLAFGVLAGAAVGALYAPGGMREEVENVWKGLPEELREPADSMLARVKARFTEALGVYRTSKEETKARLEQELKSARSAKS
jgi:hypothetical protein